MNWWASIVGIVLIYIILMDAFEVVVLPRRIRRHLRIASLFYKKTWKIWTRVGSHIKSPNRREGFLAYYGPLSLIILLGFWALSLIFGFACVQYGLGEHVSLATKKLPSARSSISAAKLSSLSVTETSRPTMPPREPWLCSKRAWVSPSSES